MVKNEDDSWMDEIKIKCLKCGEIMFAREGGDHIESTGHPDEFKYLTRYPAKPHYPVAVYGNASIFVEGAYDE